jgi:hypothetical protein
MKFPYYNNAKMGLIVKIGEFHSLSNLLRKVNEGKRVVIINSKDVGIIYCCV